VGSEVFLTAAGGQPGLAGTGQRARTDAIRVSAALLTNHVEIRDLVYLLGAAWQSVSILNLPCACAFQLLLVFEASGVPEGEYTIHVDVAGPDAVVRNRVSFPLTVSVAGEVLRIPRAVGIATTVDAFGLWSFNVLSETASLANIELAIRRATDP
jgi:hypothetical protein